ncbi:MAG: APC family permease [Anaerolineae bacterium]|nr:APC family permease [Anaerolineae bacterium]
MKVSELMFGKRLATKDLAHQAISKKIGLAVFASDAISSTAYATQEILIILSIAAIGSTNMWQTQGAVLGISIPIAIMISILLAIVTISYRQTIYAYPNGGGAYIVARDNLGEVPAQVAGAALLTDYILTVAVSISAGVAQITSYFPALLPYRVYMAVGVIFLITIVNLRGVKESGSIFAIPTYFFLGIMVLTLIIGFVRLAGGSLATIDPASVEMFHHPEELVTPEAGWAFAFLILRAFSSGCTALTGIEAISNGITAFREPRSANAAKTLIAMSAILVTLFISITVLAVSIHAIPSEGETVISQLGRVVFGQGSLFHFLLLGGTALILLMAANTSYADFPRLAALQASDGFLPRQLTYRGGRLVFSWGIMFLAIAAAALVVIEDASTTGLIPLYAIGVFLSFTMSQTGMAVRMQKVGKLKPGERVKGLETDLVYDEHWRKKQIISIIGAISTFVVMIIFAVTKFTHGAWFILLLIPTLIWIFFRIHNHYKEVAHQLSLSGKRPDTTPRAVQTVILVDDVHRETARVVNFAKSLQHPWKAIHIAVNPEKAQRVEDKWKERIGEGQLEIVPSPYRLLAEPIADYIEAIQSQMPGCFVHVIIGHLAMDTYWEQALHQNSSFILNLVLSRMDNVVFTTVPYHIHRTDDDEGDGQTSALKAAEKVEIEADKVGA